MILGKNVETGENVELDLKKLIRTRLLIQANSGGGKSWCARRIMEQTSKDVQHIIIDTEGEFSTLREKYDYLLIGSDGEIPATIKTAGLLPKKIMQMKLSVIIDLSEMSKTEKCNYVKKFLEELIILPRELWTPVLVFIDEAHDFAPESGKGKSEARPAVIGLCSKGRKRRYGSVLMTQRGAKLNKDATAECNNKLTGLANIPTDRKVAAADLGFTTKEQEIRLRQLEPGEMYGYGSAVSKEVIKIKIGPVFTTHEEDEDGEVAKPAKTPDNIKKLMNKFIDLPKEAEKELRDITDCKNKIVELKLDLRKALNSQPKPEADERALQRARDEGSREMQKVLSDREREYNQTCKAFQREIKYLERIIENVGKVIGVKVNPVEIPEMKPLPPRTPPTQEVACNVPQVSRKIPVFIGNREFSDEEPKTAPLGLCGRNIYSVLYANSTRELTKVQLGLLSGYSVKSSGFNNALSQLNTMGLLERINGKLKIKEVNAEFIKEGFGEISKELWSKSLGKCPRKIFEFLLENEIEFEKEEVAERVGYSVTSSGFNNALSQLNSLGLIKRDNGLIKINPEILEL